MELPFKELTHKIIGCALEVHRVPGPGFLDYIYHRALAIEMNAKSDLDNTHLAQAINYIEASSIPAGPLIKFGAASLQFNRLHNKKLFPADKTAQS